MNTFYDAGPYRSSDHDPVVVGLQIGVRSGTDGKLEGTPKWVGDITTKLNVIAKNSEIKGRVTFDGAGRSYESSRIDSIVVNGADATVFGAFGLISFRIDVCDGGARGDDTFRLRTSSGFDSGLLRLSRGNLSVLP